MEYFAYLYDESERRKFENRRLIKERREIRKNQVFRCISERRFIELFRLDKKGAQKFIDDLSPHLKKQKYISGN